MSDTHHDIMLCERCGAKFSFRFIDNINEGDIYECEFCNQIIIKGRTQEEEDVMEYDN